MCCILSEYLDRYPVYVLFHGCICVSITLLTMTLIINRQSTSEVSKGGQGQRSDSLTPHVSFSTVFQSACGKRLWILKLTRETSLRTGLSSLSQLLSKETKLSKLTLLLCPHLMKITNSRRVANFIAMFIASVPSIKGIQGKSRTSTEAIFNIIHERFIRFTRESENTTHSRRAQSV